MKFFLEVIWDSKTIEKLLKIVLTIIIQLLILTGVEKDFSKRVTGDLFYDNTLARINENRNYGSIGNEFSFDVSLFSILPLNLQLQYAYLLDKNEGNISWDFSSNM